MYTARYVIQQVALDDVWWTMANKRPQLVMNDGYLPGAAVLAKSLRDAGTERKLACMIVQENLRQSTVEELQVRLRANSLLCRNR